MPADEIEFGNPLMEDEEVIRSNPMFEAERAERDAAAGGGAGGAVVLQQTAKQAKADKKKKGMKKGPGSSGTDLAVNGNAPGRGPRTHFSAGRMTVPVRVRGAPREPLSATAFALAEQAVCGLTRVDAPCCSDCQHPAWRTGWRPWVASS